MKYTITFFIVLFGLFHPLKSVAQSESTKSDSLELHIRALEEKESKLFGSGDLVNLYKLWDDHFFYSQNGRLISFGELKNVLSRKKFTNEPTAKSFSVYPITDVIVIVMGSYRSQQNNNIQVDFNDTWVKKNMEWRLVARSTLAVELERK